VLAEDMQRLIFLAACPDMNFPQKFMPQFGHFVLAVEAVGMKSEAQRKSWQQHT